MKCPQCNQPDTRVIDSRPLTKEIGIRRRRECPSCGYRFTTYEYIALSQVLVIKSNGTREEFNREKLIHSIQLSCTKRPVSLKTIQNIAYEIEQKIEQMGISEVKSSFIGEEVIQRLRQIDKVAYIRFASVYHEFQDVTEFKKEIKVLEEDT
ncbi:MAG: transcriptional regulator NrdR [Candidatus Marinimicrobia bacterium]|jgi:transcriptional repressor NrdR|nr:transcriptional regulator NrdR [Candidatus Neomarinimicrobiota bacterium]MDD5582391.1 transcriptional regulator NrdR [Candidatus Neomarinimicrobiota bacterium]